MNSIKEVSQKIKSFYYISRDRIRILKNSHKIGEDLFVVLIIILVGLISFGLGRLSAFEKDNQASTVSSIQDR